MGVGVVVVWCVLINGGYPNYAEYVFFYSDNSSTWFLFQECVFGTDGGIVAFVVTIPKLHTLLMIVYSCQHQRQLC